MDGRSVIVLQAAVVLIASGGAYIGKTTDDVIPEVLAALDTLDAMFDEDDAEPETVQ